MRGMRFLTPVILLLALNTGCTEVDPLPLVDAQGNPIRFPDAWDTWLEVEEITPADTEIPVMPIFRVSFPTYLRTVNVLDVDMVSLNSGGIRAGGRSTYDMVDKTLVFRPFSPLIVGLDYTLTLNPNRVESVTGSPLAVGRLPTYSVRSEAPPHTAPDIVTANWQDVAAIFEAKCWGCHQDPEWRLNPLTRESMIGVLGESVDVFVVKPRDPAGSYLMHKILPDYPLRRFGVQPPEWSSEPPLTKAELKVIQAWVQAGAP